MKREWTLVGGPTTEWRGVNPDGTHIMVETANYWMYLNGQYYVGPFVSEECVRRAAATKLLFDRKIINVIRDAAKVIKEADVAKQLEVSR
jgi:hypothetical protein